MADERTQAPEALAQAMREIVDARFPGRFHPEQSEQIEKRIASLADTIQRLRGYRLTNADEPDQIFRALAEG